MKYFKHILCMTLAVCLLFLSACGGRNRENTTGIQGRYVETDITPPIEGRFMSFPVQDGTIVCFSTGLQTRYDSTDGGESWRESPGPGSNTDRYMNVNTGTLLPDGRLLAFVQDEGFTLIAPDGSGEHYPISEIDAAIANDEGVATMLIQSLGNDRLILGYSIGGMSIQGSRPIGQTPQGGTPPEGARNASGPDNSGDVMASVSISEPVSVSGPDTQGPNSGPQGSGPQGSGPQRSDTQSGNSTVSFASITRKTLLFEMSSGRLIAELPDENAFAAAADDETVYLMDSMGAVNGYSLLDGASSNRTSVNLGGVGGGNMFAMPLMGFGSGVLAVSGDGGMYALYDGNLLRCGVEGDIDTVLEGTAYSIGSPNSAGTSVHVLDDGSIIVNMLENMQANRLYKYVWDENSAINPDKTLSVWSLEENAFVRAAIAELRKKNPDSYITYEVAMGGDNAVSATDAIITLNTRLLSDSGPDVIILDGCPADSYAGRGMLLELSGLIDTGNIFQNLISPYITDGKMYCMPTQLLMPALMGSAEALGNVRTLDDLVSIVVNGNDTPALRTGAGPFNSVPENERAELYFEDLEELCNIMWMSGAPAIIDNNRLDLDALRHYLEAVKAISDKYNLTYTDSENSVSIGVAFASGGRATVLPGSLVRYTSQMTNYGAFSVSNLMLLQITMDRIGSEMALFPGLVSGAWRPSTVAGVFADTEVADFAVELLITMISVEVQQINYGAGLPVTREGITAQISSINEMRAENGQDAFDINMEALVETLRTPSVNDTTLTEMMWGSVEKLCKGETDVEGAVREIEQNVKNYLAERE